MRLLAKIQTLVFFPTKLAIKRAFFFFFGFSAKNFLNPKFLIENLEHILLFLPPSCCLSTSSQTWSCPCLASESHKCRVFHSHNPGRSLHPYVPLLSLLTFFHSFFTLSFPTPSLIPSSLLSFHLMHSFII